MPAILRPSAADRWSNCLGSVVLHAEEVDADTTYRAAGSAMHLAAAELIGHPHISVSEYIGSTIRTDDGPVEFTDEHAECVAEYLRGLQFYREQAVEVLLFGVEESVSISDITGEKGANGTVDFFMVVRLADGTIELQVHDLKTGFRAVQPESKQLMIYASALLRRYGWVGNIASIRLVIHQPRVYNRPREWQCDIGVLRERIAALRIAARKALELRGEDLLDHLSPGGDQCEWCSAKITCPGMLKYIGDAMGGDISDARNITAVANNACGLAGLVDPAVVAEQYKALDVVEMWVKAVRSRAFFEVKRGALPGFKLVHSKPGSRAWESASAAEIALEELGDARYTKKFITPPQAEKLAKKQHPDLWAAVAPIITRPPGKPTIATEDDPRPRLVQFDFEDLTKGE